MTIEIQQPELEALILDRMQSGVFSNIEDFLLQTIKAAPVVPSPTKPSARTGADLIAALRACPYPDFDFEPKRYPMPVRDPEL